MTKAVFALGPSAHTLHKVTGDITPKPLNSTPIAPPRWRPSRAFLSQKRTLQPILPAWIKTPE
jgi:hypothetical protein